ncbi:MAG: hypothetical protein IOC52_02790 [Methylobacterium sp.]|nr:hypothetical protein [Methylobacterium sp.]
MATYSYRFKNLKTGKPSSNTIDAFDETEMKSIIESRGLELIDFVIVPEDQATNNQVSYLIALGYTGILDITKSEASSIIDNIKQNREPASQSEFKLAQSTQTIVTRFDSKDAIYRKIFHKLKSKSIYDLACWYVFRVYRSEINKSAPDGIREIYDPIFFEIARAILDDDKYKKSLIRAANSSKNGFRWFGNFVVNGQEIQGESTRTQLYIYAIEELKLRYHKKNTSQYSKKSQSIGPAFPTKPNRLEANSIQPEEDGIKNGKLLIIPWVFIGLFFLIGWLFR